MKSVPMTYAQAQQLSRRFQYLRGQSIDPEVMGKGVIECIAVAPYEVSHKWMFAQLYRECGDPEKALGLYKDTAFDVILLARPLLRKRGINYIELHRYISLYQGPLEVSAYQSLARRS